LNQLLEMRYYDDLLDERLNKLYNSVVGKKKGIFSKEYARFAEKEFSLVELRISLPL